MFEEGSGVAWRAGRSLRCEEKRTVSEVVFFKVRPVTLEIAD
jgi:hypothetical protein